MLINWRDQADYEFNPRTLSGGCDKEHHTNTIESPIMGGDTETFDDGIICEPQCFQVSTPWDDQLIYLSKNSVALMEFMDYLLLFEDNIMETGRHSLMYFHNLEFDWNQLIKNHPALLEMTKIGLGPSQPLDLFNLGNRRIILQPGGLFVGNAPHFTLRIQRSKSHWWQVHFRDTWSYFPTTLDKMAKDLKLDLGKKKRDEELGLIDFRDVPASDPRKKDFEDYSVTDAIVTRLAGEKIRELHISEHMRKIRVSGPSFAIASLFHGMDPDQNIVSGTDDPSMMQLIFDTYRGGRTGGIYHGRVKNLSIYDFHSSYPASMVSLPSFSESMAYVRVDNLDIENVLSIIKEIPSSFLRVSGVEHDHKYPGLITTIDHKLTPVYGEFSNIATTGVELYVAVQSGTLELSEVHEMIVLVDFDKDIPLPFKDFAYAGYAQKEGAKKGSASYLAGKLKLNSAYGKLIESRHSTMIGATDANVSLPYPRGQEKAFANYYYMKYVECIEDGHTFFESYDLVIREVYDSMQPLFEEMNPGESFAKEWETNWDRELFGNMSISGKVYGYHAVPAAASLITATSRARLCAGMKALEALYWDTDSLFITATDPEWINERLQLATSWLPQGILSLDLGPMLGALDQEMKNGHGYLAGTKRYYLQSNFCMDCGGEWEEPFCPTCDKKIMKKAIHGIPALSYEKVEQVIEALASGGEEIRDAKGKKKGTGIRYESKPRPLKAKEAPTSGRIGAFESKEYAPLFHLDSRLQWKEVDGGWLGNVKYFSEQAEPLDQKRDNVQYAKDIFGN